MHITIRPAERKDCPRLLELVRELAIYEKAPEEVTVTIEHFDESELQSRHILSLNSAE